MSLQAIQDVEQNRHYERRLDRWKLTKDLELFQSEFNLGKVTNPIEQFTVIEGQCIRLDKQKGDLTFINLQFQVNNVRERPTTVAICIVPIDYIRRAEQFVSQGREHPAVRELSNEILTGLQRSLKTSKSFCLTFGRQFTAFYSYRICGAFSNLPAG